MKRSAFFLMVLGLVGCLFGSAAIARTPLRRWTPQNFKGIVLNQNTLGWSWDADFSAPVTGYEVLDQANNVIATIPGPGSTPVIFVESGLGPATQFSRHVVAVNGTLVSPPTAAIVLTTPVAPSGPQPDSINQIALALRQLLQDGLIPKAAFDTLNKEVDDASRNAAKGHFGLAIQELEDAGISLQGFVGTSIPVVDGAFLSLMIDTAKFDGASMLAQTLVQTAQQQKTVEEARKAAGDKLDKLFPGDSEKHLKETLTSGKDLPGTVSVDQAKFNDVTLKKQVFYGIFTRISFKNTGPCKNLRFIQLQNSTLTVGGTVAKTVTGVDGGTSATDPTRANQKTYVDGISTDDSPGVIEPWTDPTNQGKKVVWTVELSTYIVCADALPPTVLGKITWSVTVTFTKVGKTQGETETNGVTISPTTPTSNPMNSPDDALKNALNGYPAWKFP